MNEDWMSSGLCKVFHIDPNVFFPDRGMNDIRATAKNICNNCIVREDCLDYAITNQVDGIWGGHTRKEREQIARFRSHVEDNPDSLTG